MGLTDIMSSPPTSPGSAIKNVLNGVQSQATSWRRWVMAWEFPIGIFPSLDHVTDRPMRSDAFGAAPHFWRKKKNIPRDGT
ncbi:hypothetical protein J6590_079108 [Homalodisca vitripennis]|nr:hypothetical protein J6590_079108 [Homalodisca vitripennis]